VIGHRSPHFADELAAACSNGIEVYCELVSGAVQQSVFPLMN
jgi:NADPH-dependent curcumin reductase CurA